MSAQISAVRFAGLILLTAAMSPAFTSAAEPASPTTSAASALPPATIVRGEITRPDELLTHPLLEQIHQHLERSVQWQAEMQKPEIDRARGFARVVEQAMDMPWQQAVQRTLAGGVHFALVPGPPPRLVIIISADSTETMQKAVAFAEHLLDLASTGKEKPPVTRTTLEGQPVFRIKDGWASRIGPHLLLSSDQGLFQQTANRLRRASRAGDPSEDAPATYTTADIQLNLRAITRAPKFRKPLQSPAENIGLTTLAGGWVDLLRRGETARLQTDYNDTAITTTLTLAATDNQPDAALGGFFATTGETTAAPLLQPPGTIISASWYRDYHRLWETRDELLSPEALKRLEDGNERIGKQLQSIGARTTPAELFQHIGPHFRIVALRQHDTPYRVQMEEHLPAIAGCVDLRDAEGFRKEALPVLRAIGLIAAFGQAKMLTRSSQHAGIDVVSLRFSDGEEVARTGNRNRFHFSPSYAITDDHFIAGSTYHSVCTVIDELTAPSQRDAAVTTTAVSTTTTASAAEPTRRENGAVTSRQLVSLSGLADALDDYRQTFTRELILDTGLPRQEADAELDILADILRTLGQLSGQARYDGRSYEYRLTIQPEQK